MSVKAKTHVNVTAEFSPKLVREILSGVRSAGQPATFWTGKQFLWLSEFRSGYQITSGNPNLHSNNADGFFIEEFCCDLEYRELYEMFLRIIPEGSMVTYPVFTELKLPLTLKIGDEETSINIYKDDALVAIYQDETCYTAIKEENMRKLIPEIFGEDSGYISITENPTGVFLASFS